MLLVDADSDFAATFKVMLEKSDITVLTCASSEDAFKLVGETRFDAIVASVQLPGISGVDLLAKVRQTDPDIPFLLISESEDSGTAVQALKLGAQDYIVKPIREIDDLLVSLHKSVARHRLVLKNREMEQSLRQTNDELQSLWAYFIRMQEQERGELARELHDEVGQMLVALGMSLAVIQNGLPAETNASLVKSICDSREQLKGLNERLRAVMGALRPPVIDDYGLVAALKWYSEHFSKRTGISVEIRGDGDGVRLPALSEVALFRVAQEAMSNIAEHSNATRALITVVSVADSYRVTITDDGSGFDVNQKLDRASRSGWGLVTMRERVRDVGGQFAIKSSPGNGTQVVVEVGSVCRSI